jgi:hypothetical protein
VGTGYCCYYISIIRPGLRFLLSIESFGGENGHRQFGSSKRRCENNIKIGLKETGFDGGVDRIHLTQASGKLLQAR